MENELMNAVLSALGTILIALIGYVARKVAVYLDEKGVTEKLSKKQYLADIVVNAIEQVYLHEDGETKKQYAKEEFLRLLSENGLTVKEHELNSFLEAAVKAMNDGFKTEKLPEITEEEL